MNRPSFSSDNPDGDVGVLCRLWNCNLPRSNTTSIVFWSLKLSGMIICGAAMSKLKSHLLDLIYNSTLYTVKTCYNKSLVCGFSNTTVYFGVSVAGFFFKFWRIQVPFVGPLISYCGLLVMSALGFKARVDPLHAFSLVWSSDPPLVWHLLTGKRSAW